MIKIINKNIDALIALLNEKHPEGPDVFLHIIEDCDTIDTGQGVGFGVYNTETMEIYVAGDLPEPEAVLHTIAHEFAHHLQNQSGEGYDEEYADEFAAAILEELKEKGVLTMQKDCDTCFYYGKAADAPETTPEECMYIPAEDEEYTPPCERSTAAGQKGE